MCAKDGALVMLERATESDGERRSWQRKGGVDFKVSSLRS